MKSTPRPTFAHARMRALERHGIDLSARHFARICEWIEGGNDSVVLLRDYPDGSACELAVRLPRGRWLPVVWLVGPRYVATVLPRDVLDTYAVTLGQWEMKHEGVKS